MHIHPSARELLGFALGASLWLLATPGAHAHEVPRHTYKVLILNSYSQDTPPYAVLRDNFIERLQTRAGLGISFVQFDLQQRNGEEQATDTLRAQLLKSQHEAEVPDLVVALGPPAVAFWLSHRDQVFPAVPTLLTGSELLLRQFELQDHDVVVASQWTFEEMVNNILQLLPQTRHILVLFGGSDNEGRLEALARESLAPYAAKVEIAFAGDISLNGLREQLSSLKEDSAVLFGVYDSDAEGVILGGETGLALVRASSNAPIFGFFEEQIGQGVVGGPLIPLRRTSEGLAASALEILQTGSARTQWKAYPLNVPTYDWRELEKWNIAQGLLPKDSIVRFRPASVWDSYARWILLALVVLLVQAVLIAGLLLQRRQRRIAEQASLSLTRRLLTAHEDEQRRIARELHDDLSQRLARLSIDAGYLAANPGGEAAAEVARDMQPRLVSISKDVHDMSYLLHPSMVDELGISAALNSECERIRRRSGLTVIERVADIPGDVPHDTALALFRIAQEALHNAERHAEAEVIELSLGFDGTMFRLVVRDDGKGFDPSPAPQERGLGLYSMRERASLARGSIKINSETGAGTRVVAIIPLAGGRN